MFDQVSARLRRRLLSWYRSHKRDLPWRRSRDSYAIWVSEIMLQQTRVETVRLYYDRFLERFPGVEALARARVEEVLRLWSGLGYYGRARRMHEAARRMVAEHAGSFPRTIEEARRLPGVGEYTAAAVLSIAYGLPHAVVDGNVARVLARLWAVEEPIDSGGGRRRLHRLAGDLLARKVPGEFNQALMELGARICTSVLPACEACPVEGLCLARAAGAVLAYPRKKGNREPSERVTMAGALLRRRRSILVVRRSGTTIMDGLWELPMIEVPEGKDLRAALAAFLRARLGFAGTLGSPLPPIRHSITNRRITLRLFPGEVRRVRRLTPRERFVLPERAPTLALTGLTRKVLKNGAAAFFSRRGDRILFLEALRPDPPA